MLHLYTAKETAVDLSLSLAHMSEPPVAQAVPLETLGWVVGGGLGSGIF